MSTPDPPAGPPGQTPTSQTPTSQTPAAQSPAKATRPGVVRRAWSWVRLQWVFVLVVAALAACFLYLLAEPSHPVRGTGAIGVVLLVAGALRLVVPQAHVGLLAVRSRGVDAACYLVLGALILGTDLRLLHGV